MMSRNKISDLKNLVHNELDQEFEWEELEKGLNTLYLLTGEDRELVLKERTNEENKIEWFKAEPLIYDRFQNQELFPSPKIIYRDLSQENWSNCFYIMEKLEGENPDECKKEYSISQLESILFQYGEILGKVHNEKFNFKTYGLISGDSEQLETVEDAEKWTWSIEGAVEAWQTIIRDKWENPPELEDLKREIIRDRIPDRPENVLIHSDNRLDNLLVKNGRISGFLDWSHPRTGHKEYDLVRAEYLLIDWDLEHLERMQKEKLRDSLYSGYQETNSFKEKDFESRRKFYRYVTVHWMMAGFANWGSEWPEDEKQEMREKLIRRFDREKGDFAE